MTTDNRYRSRKFRLALLASVVSHIALFVSFFSAEALMDGGTWVAAQTLILAMYNGANVGELYVKPDR